MSIATVRVLIADDSEIFRRGLTTLLSQHPGKWEICAEAADGEEALRKVEALRPDVILLDLSIPILSGLDMAKILKRKFPSVRIIIMSEQDASVLLHVAKDGDLKHTIAKSRIALDLIPMLFQIADEIEAAQ